MFFIVFLCEPKVNVVILHNWIYEIEKQWAKFLNNSINRNQKYLCYYSEELCALDARGRPNINWMPDWRNVIASTTVFPEAGFYHGKLISYKGEFIKMDLMNFKIIKITYLFSFQQLVLKLKKP